MIDDNCRAPKVSKEHRKIKSINERQFHHVFNNKIDFSQLIRYNLSRLPKDYISNVRNETYRFQKDIDLSEETKVFTLSSCPSKITHDESKKEDSNFGDHIHKILICNNTKTI